MQNRQSANGFRENTRSSENAVIDIPKEELERKYIDEDLSIEECAEYFGCSPTPIANRLRAYDIEVRNRGNQPLNVSRNELYELYVEEGLTTIEVAEQLDCHPSTVGKKLQEHGIPTTGENHGRSIPIPKRDLIESYVEEGQTTYEIAERYDCDPTVIERRLRWYGIERRHTDAGADTWDYKYGAGWRRQRRKALERADHQCERCGITDDDHREKYIEPTRDVGFGLDVHHRVSVRLFKRWDLPLKDANRLSNLEVLCQSCHLDYGDRVGTFEVIEE